MSEMGVAAKLAMFTTALVLAVLVGWTFGQLVGGLSLPLAPSTDPFATTNDHSGAPHATRYPEDR
jgi:hypothetical protein